MAKNINEMSLEELQAALSEKKKEETEKRRMKKSVYEQDRDRLIDSVMQRAKVMHNQMRDFKQWALEQFEAFREKAFEYGDIRSNSKGGFSLRHSITQEMISLDRNIISEYDERLNMAEDLMKEFLEDKVKKKDLQSYRTISTLLARNKNGDYTPARVASLLKIKDNYTDRRWVKAMELLEESYTERDISYSVSFYKKDDMGKDMALILTFASIPVHLHTVKTDEPKKD